MKEKCKYKIVSTYYSNDSKKFYDLTETVHLPYNKIINKVNYYYKKGAEAVTLEMLTNDK